MMTASFWMRREKRIIQTRKWKIIYIIIQTHHVPILLCKHSETGIIYVAHSMCIFVHVTLNGISIKINA